MLSRLGPAINSGRGLFLYGAAGNGKTSIAERVTKAFGQFIWIPRAIGVDGEIIRLYDPSNHEETPLESTGGLLDNRKIDKRWIRIRRPTIVAGGELTMDNLEVTRNTSTGICESPMQLKSNCGTLVIDDFGRQRMSTDELLNRWIVPLEKRFDFLNLPNGKKIQVPFDQLIIFSTNLQPRDLVDEAFLRRIPYKIDVADPSEDEFRQLFKIMAPKLGFEYREEPVDYVVKTHYVEAGRPFRNCQPRDLLMQVRNHCFYENRPLELTREYFDHAVENYFAMM
jgi:predicted ATPase with chaperone activity